MFSSSPVIRACFPEDVSYGVSLLDVGLLLVLVGLIGPFPYMKTLVPTKDVAYAAALPLRAGLPDVAFPLPTRHGVSPPLVVPPPVACGLL